MRIHTDLSRVPISVAPNPATSGTSLGVTDANAAYLPDTYPYWATLVPTGAAPTRANAEIVKVTAGSSSGGTTTLTIVRAQGIPVTTAQSVTTSFDIYDANSAEVVIEDGWTPARQTWTYASASAITVPSGAASIYQKGDRIKWTQTTVKYGVIVTVADTLLTIAVNTDYTVADAAISANYYSHQANPLGYPTWFAYTPSFATGSFDNGSGGQPTISNARLRIDGSMFTSHIKCNGVKVYGDSYIGLYHHLALANTSYKGILGYGYSYIGSTNYSVYFFDYDGTNHYIVYPGVISDNTVIADLSIWYQHEF